MTSRLPLICLACLLALNFILRLLVAIRPLEFIDGLTIPDDAYLSLTLAKNIAAGLGPWYAVDHTNGFQPLYVFLMVPVFRLSGENLTAPIHIALVLLSLADTVALYFVFRLVALFSRSRLTPFFVATAWTFNWYSIYTATNGLETSLAFALLAMCVYYICKWNFASDERPQPKRLLILGALTGLAILARIDNVFILSTILLLRGIGVLTRRQSLGRNLKIVALFLVTVAAIQLPWFAYSYYFTGDIYPISGRAVRYLSIAREGAGVSAVGLIPLMFRDAGETLLRFNVVTLGTLLSLGIGLAIAGRFRSRPLSTEAVTNVLKPYNFILLFSVQLVIAYASYIFGQWYYYRYLFPVTLLLAVYLGALFDLFVLGLDKKRLQFVFGVAMFAGVVTANVIHRDFRPLYASTRTNELGYMNLGLWARETFEDGTTVGCAQSGGLGYFAENLTVINLDGVVNKECFESMRENRHFDYIRETGVEYIIGWSNRKWFIDLTSESFDHADLVSMGKIEGFRSWGQEWEVYRVNDEP